MKTKNKKFFMSFFLWVFLVFPFLGNKAKSEVQSAEITAGAGGLFSSSEPSKSEEEKTSEFWMGVYMGGIKIGYSHNQEFFLIKNGKKFKKDLSESLMKVTRLGGNPVEIVTAQESLYDEHGKPQECTLRMKMSESEIVTKAEISPDNILFKSGDKIIKELPYNERFYLEVPVEKITRDKGLKSGKKFNFKILDFTSYSLVDCSFEIIGQEDVLILGKKMRLWHAKGETTAAIPLAIDEWLDENGNSWRSLSKTSFVALTSIRMPKEKALEISEENFDIAFSSVIKPNVTFKNPQKIQRVTFKLSGVSTDKIKNFPFDDGSQKIIEVGKDYVVVQTSSQIFKEDEAVLLPVEGPEFSKFLKSSSFCQADDPEIQAVAKKIVGQERNSWRASKKIAEWVEKEMTPTYDVGFATAKEIIKNREGDCSEHTVLTVALCRAVGIPARAAVGIMYGRGLFAYHMWTEVYVGRWISLDSKWLSVDKKSGEYYTDATHLKFGRSLLDENIFKEMAQAISEIIGQLKLEIIDYY
jgi:hypothetical protein